MFGGSCSLKGGYRIANKRHYLKKSIKKRSKGLKRRSKSIKRQSKSLKKRGGGYGSSGGSSLGSYIKPYKKRGGGRTHKYPEGHH
jgi:hypothetical protein